MEKTIPRDVLLALVEEHGQPGSAHLVASVISAFGWDNKEEFTKNDFLSVLQGVTEAARQELDNPATFGGATARERAQIGEMLDSLDNNAIPLALEPES